MRRLNELQINVIYHLICTVQKGSHSRREASDSVDVRSDQSTFEICSNYSYNRTEFIVANVDQIRGDIEKKFVHLNTRLT